MQVSICLLLLSACSTWGLKQAMFERIAVMKESVNGHEDIALDNKGINACAQKCLGNDSCSAFTIAEKDGSFCRFQNPEGLIPMTDLSGNYGSNVWLKDGNMTCKAYLEQHLVAHRIIPSLDGNIHNFLIIIWVHMELSFPNTNSQNVFQCWSLTFWS